MTEEEKKAYRHQYYLDHKERIREYYREYCQNPYVKKKRKERELRYRKHKAEYARTRWAKLKQENKLQKRPYCGSCIHFHEFNNDEKCHEYGSCDAGYPKHSGQYTRNGHTFEYMDCVYKARPACKEYKQKEDNE